MTRKVLRQETAPLFDQFTNARQCLAVSVYSFGGVIQGASTGSFHLTGYCNVTVGAAATTFTVGVYFNTVCISFSATVVGSPISFSKSDEFLTSAEIIDVNESWREIEEGKVKRFRNIDELLKELKS